MKNYEIITNSNLLALRDQVDSLIFTLDKQDKDKYEKRLVDSLANIYETFQSNVAEKDLKAIKTLTEAMIFRN